ncbi:MAG: DNA polymerase III subunit gamma/tau [Actinomycetota bacterium]
MAYQSLYRRYRSQRFAEVLGQPHVTDALRSAVAEGRQSHAYLFSGPRGTGKTSTARVLAKALNCENLTDGEPCGVCESCVAIEEGRSFDLHELDAASHNKVDDVRDLISKVQLGSPGRTKVYILDEVHMLSSGAENALLKTLEEPPEHVVFVLATTEPQKVVPTIRSRTQHFAFHLLPADVLAEHVRWVIDDAGLDVDDDAIEYVLRAGGGSARDTLSALDLVAAGGGIPQGAETAEALARAIGANDPGAAIAAVQSGLELGREPRTIGEDLLDLLRNAFLVAMQAPLAHLNDHARATANDIAGLLGPASITRSLESIGQALVEMRQAADPRIPLEVSLLGLARAPGATTAAGTSDDAGGAAPTAGAPSAELMSRIGKLEARIAELEAQVASGVRSAAAAGSPAPPSQASAPPADASAGRSEGAGRPDRRPRSPRSNRPPSSADRPARPAPANAAPTAGSAPDGEGAPAAVPEPAPGPGSAPQPAAEQAPQPAAAASNGGASLTTASVSAAFTTELEQLSQKVRSRFRGGQVLGVDGSTVRFGVTHAIHRERCMEVKGDVEAALAANLGQPVTIQVEVDGAPAPAPEAPTAPQPRSAPADPVAEAADVGPVEDLVNANDTASNSVDRLTQAFPGSEVIDNRGDNR